MAAVEVHMLGEQALVALESLTNGKTTDLARKVFDALVAEGFAIAADPARFDVAREFEKVRTRYQFSTPVEARAALADLEEKLKSDFHRATTFATTLWEEEQDRARLRAAVGLLGDRKEWAAVREAIVARDRAARGAPFVVVPGVALSYAITDEGRRAASGLRARLDRYGKAAFRDFVKRFRKADAGMAALAQQQRTLLRKLPSTTKGRTSLSVSLLKTGLAPDVALERWRSARNASLRGAALTELPHIAAAVVRESVREDAAGGDPAQAAAMLVQAYEALVAAGMPRVSVVRGAAKSIVAMPDHAAAARHFRALVSALEAERVPADNATRHAARLVGVVCTPAEIVARIRRACALTGRPIGEATVALVAISPDAASLAPNATRFLELTTELRSRRAFRGEVPDSAVELVPVAGTVGEVVELVRQLVAHLPASEAEDCWGMSDDWMTAIAFAKRFVY
jgi:hypothetical protein